MTTRPTGGHAGSGPVAKRGTPNLLTQPLGREMNELYKTS